ncbi:uncharacterized protein DS421_10g296710 [Arachis hypogaea]|nr:uncharacterized protein DS421_10g296710 [Arachis hypogaea]
MMTLSRLQQSSDNDLRISVNLELIQIHSGYVCFLNITIRPKRKIFCFMKWASFLF